MVKMHTLFFKSINILMCWAWSELRWYENVLVPIAFSYALAYIVAVRIVYRGQS